jgi:hypothetical protein
MSICLPETRSQAAFQPDDNENTRRGDPAGAAISSGQAVCPPARGGRAGRLACAAMLAVALGYMEASVVVYLRRIIAPVRRVHRPAAVAEPLPLLTVGQLSQAGREFEQLLVVEVAREIAPLVILAAASWALRRRKGEAAAFFMLGFGLWDILYYLFLKVLLGWPASLGTWDVLYLIPTAWVAPVWAPLVIAGTLVVAGLGILLRRGELNLPRRCFVAWFLLAVGTALVLTSFFLRTAEAFEAVPARFDWAWFLGGWLLVVSGLVLLLRPGRRGESRARGCA